MTRSQLINNLLKLDPILAVKALRNDKLTARLKVDQLLKELGIKIEKAD